MTSLESGDDLATLLDPDESSDLTTTQMDTPGTQNDDDGKQYDVEKDPASEERPGPESRITDRVSNAEHILMIIEQALCAQPTSKYVLNCTWKLC